MPGDECPVGCGRPVQPGKLMDPACWREVPKPLQRDVYRTFRAWQADFGDTDALHDYKAAREAAIAAVA